MLPEAAATDAYRDRIVSHYPFHPSLTDYLNQKLSTVETFQGTRGVLRLLARTVRCLWGKARQTAPAIHASHLNLRDPDVVGEVLGRTGNSDLKDVLTADVGSADSAGLEGGTSNAEAAGPNSAIRSVRFPTAAAVV
jgi:predicted AAA+ superfamily ATPase